MHLKRRIMMVAAVAVLAAAALYGSTLEMSQAGEKDIGAILFGGTANKETIYFWYTDENMTSFFNSAAVEFGEREGVRVIPVLTSDGEYLEALNRASLSREMMPDVYLISNDALEKAYLAGLACEVEDARDVCSEENFPKAALDAVKYHEKTVAYPLYFETSALVYNETYLELWAVQQAEKDLAEEVSDDKSNLSVDPGASELDMERVEELAQGYFENRIPLTMDEVLNIADTFDAPEGVEVMKWDVSDIFYNYWVVGNYMVVGGDAGYDASAIDIDNEQTKQCLEMYKALNQFFSIETDNVSYDAVVEDFIDGKMVFTVGTTDVVAKLEEAKADGRFAYEYGIATMPDINEDLRSRSLSVTDAVAVNGYSEHKELANQFAAYLATESEEDIYARTGKVSANIHAEADNGAVQIFKQEYARSISLPKMMETGNFWLQLEVLFSKVWNGGDVPSLVKELAQQISAQVQSAL